MLRQAPRVILAGTAGLSGLGAVAALAHLLAGAPQAAIALPLGAPGFAVSIGVDGLSSLFLLLVFVLGAACSAYAMASAHEADRRTGPLLAGFLAVLASVPLAADAATLLLSFGLAALLSWSVLVLRAERAGRARAGAVLRILCLLPALALLAAGARDASFAAIRASPPEGWRAALVLILALLGFGGRAGCLARPAWGAHADPPLSGPVAALLAGASASVALYGLIRVSLDLAGPAQPAWWGVPLIVLGAGVAMVGALGANRGLDLVAIFEAASRANTGLVLVALGIALLARGTDLPALAALGLGVGLFQVLAHGVLYPMLILCADRIGQSAGSHALARLGGLVHSMPLTTAAALAGCAGLAAIPPGPGFALFWLLVRSLLAAARIGGVGLGWLMMAALFAITLAAGLTAAASVRVFAVAFLGRPRTPRAAAAEEAAGRAWWSVAALALLGAALGLLPRIAFVLADPARRALTGSGLLVRESWLVLRVSADAPGYTPVPIALLLGGITLAILVFLRDRAVGGARRTPIWMDGFAAPPPWLPFGDPRTQYGGASFAQPIGQILAALAPWARASGVLARARALARLGDGLGMHAARLRQADAAAELAIAALVLVVMMAGAALARALG